MRTGPTLVAIALAVGLLTPAVSQPPAPSPAPRPTPPLVRDVAKVTVRGADVPGTFDNGVWRIRGGQIAIVEVALDAPAPNLVISAFRDGNLAKSTRVLKGPARDGVLEFHMAAVDGAYSLIIDDRVNAWRIEQVVVGAVPVDPDKPVDPDDPDPPPQPTNNWVAVLQPAATAAKLSSAEAKIFADAFRTAAKGSYPTILAATTAAKNIYAPQFGPNRAVELVDFRQAMVAELERLGIKTVPDTLAEFAKIADALESLK